MSEVVYFNSDGTVSSVTGDDAVTQKNMEDLRAMRNQMLTDTDWTQGADSPLTDSQKTSWATYRQALRDMTDTYSTVPLTDKGHMDESQITWPSKP